MALSVPPVGGIIPFPLHRDKSYEDTYLKQNQKYNQYTYK